MGYMNHGTPVGGLQQTSRHPACSDRSSLKTRGHHSCFWGCRRWCWGGGLTWDSTLALLSWGSRGAWKGVGLSWVTPVPGRTWGSQVPVDVRTCSRVNK